MDSIDQLRRKRAGRESAKKEEVTTKAFLLPFLAALGQGAPGPTEALDSSADGKNHGARPENPPDK